MRRVFLAALAVVFVQGSAYAAVSCPDKSPAAITAVPAAGRKCQLAIATAGANYLRTKMGVLAACKLNKLNLPGTCPTTKHSDKIAKAAIAATNKIAAACASDTAQAALLSSYASGADPGVISSCMLSQHNVIGEFVVAESIGPTIEDMPGGGGKERLACIKEVALRARAVTNGMLANAKACITRLTKAGTAGNLSPMCVGSFSGGAWVPPTDTMTANKQAKLMALAETKLTNKCSFSEATDAIETMFGCAGSETVADLQQCVVCGGFDAATQALEQQYSETGEFVANAVGALQTAVTNASAGDKLLIGSGTYVEEVNIAGGKDNLKIVGCGGASDARPLIQAPAVQPEGRGLRAASVNGLVFQSLSLFGQDNDGIKVTLANGVTFRDIVADGNLQSAYSVFPQTSNNVVVELCKLRNVDDAPLYVGQSSHIVVRHNDVRDSVAGIEIENCGNARVYGNYATGNTGGILVFKDGSLPVQMSACHEVDHNLVEANNTPNFGSGTVAAVPDGTGILVLSNKHSTFHHNISRNHDTFGMAFTDQAYAGFNQGPDPNPENNFIYGNIFKDNGGNPDPDIGFGGDGIAIATVPLPPLGNCQVNNIFSSMPQSLVNALGSCPLPVTPTFASCPAPSVP